MRRRLAVAEAPFERVTPGTSRPACSASRARSVNVAASGAAASASIRSGQVAATVSAAARPAKLSGGAALAMATARSATWRRLVTSSRLVETTA